LYKKNLDNKIKVINLGFFGSILAVLITGLSGSLIVVGVQEASLFWFFFGLAAGLEKNKRIMPI
jgi:hypothetical protein